jgi:predicted RNase H-like nuclease (RuvC/YqgF family)
MTDRDLRAALQNLSDDSLRTSRRLDDTYYSILEKVSVLRQTIGSLQELSGLTKELHENFESESNELTEEVEGQFEGFDSFTAQQGKISDLEKRISEGREKADSLTARLSKAKAIVDARAVAEARYEANVTREFSELCHYS